jgi:hypothetical protein
VFPITAKASGSTEYSTVIDAVVLEKVSSVTL